MREKLIALSVIKKGNWDDIYQFICHDPQLDSIDELAACELVQQLGCETLTLVDSNYPKAWLEMPKPPFIVFYKGDIRRLQSKIVSVIGGKEISAPTPKSIRDVMRIIPQSMSVMSGFEVGVEVYSMHHASRRIAVIGTGLAVDKHYQKHASFNTMTPDDLILSELPPNTNFDLAAYYRTYHLMHELSDVICVFELPSFDLRLKYLAYLTDAGKEVVVAPDIVKKRTLGGLSLINLGAKLLLRPKDVFKSFDV